MRLELSQQSVGALEAARERGDFTVARRVAKLTEAAEYRRPDGRRIFPNEDAGVLDGCWKLYVHVPRFSYVVLFDVDEYEDAIFIRSIRYERVL